MGGGRGDSWYSTILDPSVGRSSGHAVMGGLCPILEGGQPLNLTPTRQGQASMTDAGQMVILLTSRLSNLTKKSLKH
jgi:hypothetical protein